MFADYEAILPGAADRILCMAEKQQQHRMSLEKTALEADAWQSKAGLFCGTFIAVFLGGAGTYLIHTGHNASGLAAVITPLVGLVGVFVYGQRARREEREQRMRDADSRSLEAPKPAKQAPSQKKSRRR
jgi:uncharacterized membrane protein